MKIYFAGSIRGGREDVNIYFNIIKYLQNFGEVLTEHVGDASLTLFSKDKKTNEFIHNRDMNWLLDSNIIIAEVTNPSLGVGYEIGRAVEHKKKVICLYQKKANKSLSAMIEGCQELECYYYSNIEEVKKILKKIFNKSIK